MKKIIILLEAIILSICILTPFSVFADSDIYQGLFRFDTLSVKYSDGVLNRPGGNAALDNVKVLSTVGQQPSPEPEKLSEENELASLNIELGAYVTRAQAVYVLVSGLGDELKAVKPADLSVFSDSSEIEPIYQKSLGLAVSLGAVNGSDDGKLHGNDYITRVEAFAIVSRVLSQDDLPTDLGDGESFFNDIPDWAVPDICRLKNAGLILGYGDGTLGSDDFMTYEQVMLVYSRLLKYQNALPTNNLYKNDYYEYVNEQWLSETQLPEGYAKWSNVEQLSQNNAYRIQNIIGDIITEYYIGNIPPKDSNKQKILDIYKASANVKYRDSVGIEPIRKYLDMIDGIQNISDFTNVMAELENNGFHSLIPIRVNNDFKDSTKYSLTFESCYTGIESGVVKSGEYEKIEENYKNYIRTLFIISGQSPAEAEKKADLAVRFCLKLANATMDESQWDNPGDIYNVYSTNSLENLFSNMNMLGYLKKLGYNNVSEIIVYDKELAKTINSLLDRDNIPMLKEYLRASVLDYSSLYLNTEMFNAYQNYINSISGVNAQITPDAYAVTITQSLMGLELGEEYVERYFSSDSKKEIEDLASVIIDTFENRIKELDWMSDDTKNVAIEKLSAISIRIGYPDYLINYTNRDYSIRSIEDGGTIMEYLIDYNKMAHNQDVALINEKVPVNKESWTLTPQTVNAYYDRANNCIVIPAGILQAPYYSPNASYEGNLGGIGSVIAHEITHAFDNVGSQFDKDGNLNDWWKAEDFSAFNQICKQFVSEYDKLEVMDGCFVDGKLTLSENIADIGGMACVLDIAGKDNPNLDELFKTYARTYRSVCTEEYAKMLLVTDEHAPNKVRVNMVLSNFEKFINLYHLQSGDGMYRNESSRLSIW